MQRSLGKSFAARLADLDRLEAEAEAEQAEPLTPMEREWLLDVALAAVAAGDAAHVADLLEPDMLATLRPEPYGIHATPAGLAICVCGKCVRMAGWQALEARYADKEL